MLTTKDVDVLLKCVKLTSEKLKHCDGKVWCFVLCTENDAGCSKVHANHFNKSSNLKQ